MLTVVFVFSLVLVSITIEGFVVFKTDDSCHETDIWPITLLILCVHKKEKRESVRVSVIEGVFSGVPALLCSASYCCPDATPTCWCL